MEDVLDVYKRPHDPRFPVVGLDEKPVQLLADVRGPLPAGAGVVRRQDHEYKRNGTANVFCASEPLGNWRRLAVTDRRTRVDWADFVRGLVDAPRYRRAEKIVLVQDQLNTHTPASLYEAFAPAEAKRIADKLEIHYTPKHGSWLNVAEVGGRQAQARRRLWRLRARTQPRQARRRLALHHRRRQDQTEAALPDTGSVVIH